MIQTNYFLSDWDTQFFGFNCGILDIKGSASCKEVLEQIKKFEYYKFSLCKVNSLDEEVNKAVEILGFKKIETAVTYEKTFDSSYTLHFSSNIIRIAVDSDLSRMQEISEQHKGSRFHKDANFDKNKVDEYRRVWIKNLYEGLADEVFVADNGLKVVGFVTVEKNVLKDEGVLKLIAVDENQRGKGYGTLLLNDALNWFYFNCGKVSITTQDTNICAKKLYEKEGCVVGLKQNVYHLWR